MVCRLCGKPVEKHSIIPDACVACVDNAGKIGKIIHGKDVGKTYVRQQVETFKAGEFIHNITQRLRIPECGGCGRRRAAMNTVNMSGPAVEVARGLFQAITNPEEVLNGQREEEDSGSEAERTERGEGEGPEGVGQDPDGEAGR